ncbi:HAMP domain-containing sensor histidine kinase [Maribacter sp. PR1]|uniref:histidine kinase n=1 Tax=Maribacter cobaltidurans TaxID=1178778 RepID=A0ABU7IXB9_9FLAO|nr:MULTISPECIES: HAMP domain-containing sensor histidine kinase [Maribacter]MDC6390145.1 HAMP domain-containing sensor histidine kinase [Maribacter sp. PR1]MEE1977535.1 HAMP domain-containing sensor histidine kinase [Maribacter cobaltidurans]
MKRKYIYIGLFFVSIVGLAIVQYQYLRIGLNLAKVQFGTRIETAAKVIKEGLEEDNKLTYLVGQAMQRDTTFFKVSIDSLENVSDFFLRDFIGEQLRQQGIESDFTYHLLAKDSSYILSSLDQFDDLDDVESYPIELEGYFADLLEKPIVLELQFNNLHKYYLSKLNGLTFPSILFLIGICVTIFWVLRTYYWQSSVITTTNEFINNLTHELKTPVFSIGLATKILDETASEKQKPVLDIIRQQVSRLSGHIEKVLELASLESGKSVITLKQVDLKPYLESLCSEFKTLISIEDGKFEYELSGEEYLVNAEVFHLENAINNILDNAKKYSQNPIIDLKSYTKKSKLYIEISDNGKGISKDDKQRVFRKFYRVVDGDLHNVKGYGLGLSYVKKVIGKHGGKVLIESEEDLGTKVTLIIPIIK